MPRKVVVWDDFTGGDFGIASPANAGSTQFNATNVLVYRNGEFGPRPAKVVASTTGLPTTAAAVGAGFSGTPGASWWLVFDNGNMYVYDDFTDSWDTAGGTAMTGVTEAGGTELQPGESFIACAGAGLFQVSHAHNGTNKVRIASGIIPTTISATVTDYKDRLYVADGQRVYYSDASDYTTFNTDNWFDVGNGPPVVSLQWSGDRLLIFLSDSSIWEYRGTPGRDTLRRIYRGARHPWLFHNKRVTTLPNDDVWFVPVDRDHPSRLINNRVVDFPALSWEDAMFDTDDDSFEAIAHHGQMDDEIFLWTSAPVPAIIEELDIMWTNKNGVWTKHSFGLRNPSVVDRLVAHDGQQKFLIISTQSTGTVLHWWDTSLDRPGFSSDQYADINPAPVFSGNTVEFRTGEWWSPGGHEVTVEKVIVDFTMYDDGSSDPSFGVDLDQLSEADFDTGLPATPGDGVRRTRVLAFSTARANASTTGVRRRAISGGVSGGPIPASGFSLRIEDMAAVTIRSIRVVINENTNTPRGHGDYS